MADYTAIVEAGNALVKLLRETLTPEPISNPELIALCSPHESENNQLTVYLFHVEEEVSSGQAGYHQYSRDVQRKNPTSLNLSFLITAHSKAPAQLRESDQYRLLGAVIQVLKDNASLGRQYLTGSLEQSGADLHLNVERPNFEQLLKIWNSTSDNYKLSVVVKLTGASIDSALYRTVSRVGDIQIALDEKPQLRTEAER